MRWRIEPEVMSGKGETICGNKTCKADKELGTWELNFRYKESEEIKNTLVKVKCCKACSE
jgi:protein FRA10AC1